MSGQFGYNLKSAYIQIRHNRKIAASLSLNLYVSNKCERQQQQQQQSYRYNRKCLVAQSNLSISVYDYYCLFYDV